MHRFYYLKWLHRGLSVLVVVLPRWWMRLCGMVVCIIVENKAVLAHTEMIAGAQRMIDQIEQNGHKHAGKVDLF